ncbi:hypothetical protein JXL83_06665 [candidate division WOR-3 bacterium]|nr:hypothetical protein [candidate division WOR-3 bacterium]
MSKGDNIFSGENFIGTLSELSDGLKNLDEIQKILARDPELHAILMEISALDTVAAEKTVRGDNPAREEEKKINLILKLEKSKTFMEFRKKLLFLEKRWATVNKKILESENIG